MITAKVNPEQYAALSKALEEEEGVLISGSTGVVNKDGIRGEYRYDGSEVFTFTVTHAPFLVPKELAESRIAAGLRQHGVECSQAG